MSEKKVTMEQLGEHKSNGDLWLLVDGKGETTACLYFFARLSGC